MRGLLPTVRYPTLSVIQWFMSLHGQPRSVGGAGLLGPWWGRTHYSCLALLVGALVAQLFLKFFFSNRQLWLLGEALC